MICDKCGAQVNENNKFCSKCGEKITTPENNINSCKKCGAQVNENDKFCSKCGEKITTPENNINTCRKCGSKLNENDKFCMNCGCPVVSRASGGNVSIMLTKLRGTISKQTVSIIGENGQELWRGNSGQIAEIYFERQTQITIKYHIAANAWSGTCIGMIDPSKCTKYIANIKRGFLETTIELHGVDYHY